MDYVKHGELLQYLNQPLDEEKAATYLIQIAAALRYCHCLGIIHRDLKFENVLVGPDDQLVLTDFGLGNISTYPDKTFFTSKTLCGSPHYIAPEVIDGNYDGKKSDIWSMGIMLYVMLMNEFPFNGKQEELYKIYTKAKAGIPSQLKCSPEANSLLKQLLNPVPDQRATFDEIF